MLGEFPFTLGRALFAARKLAHAQAELRTAWEMRSDERGAEANDARDVARKLAELDRTQKREAAAQEWQAKAEAIAREPARTAAGQRTPALPALHGASRIGQALHSPGPACRSADS